MDVWHGCRSGDACRTSWVPSRGRVLQQLNTRPIMKSRFFSAVLVAMSALIAVNSVSAAKVKVFRQDKPGDYDKAERKGTVISDAGTVRLSRKLQSLPRIEATHVWAVVEDRFGNLYAGTGDDGKVYKVTPDGKTSVVFSGDNSQVL